VGDLDEGYDLLMEFAENTSCDMAKAIMLAAPFPDFDRDHHLQAVETALDGFPRETVVDTLIRCFDDLHKSSQVLSIRQLHKSVRFSLDDLRKAVTRATASCCKRLRIELNNLSKTYPELAAECADVIAALPRRKTAKFARTR